MLYICYFKIEIGITIFKTSKTSGILRHLHVTKFVQIGIQGACIIIIFCINYRKFRILENPMNSEGEAQIKIL